MVYNINGIEYVLVKVPVNSDKSVAEFNDAANKFDGIIQDWEIMSKPFLLSPRIKICVLVPSKNIKEFNDKLYK